MANMLPPDNRPPTLPQEPQIAGDILTLPIPDYLRQEQDTDPWKSGFLPESSGANFEDPFDGSEWGMMKNNFQKFLDMNNGLPG